MEVRPDRAAESWSGVTKDTAGGGADERGAGLLPALSLLVPLGVLLGLPLDKAVFSFCGAGLVAAGDGEVVVALKSGGGVGGATDEVAGAAALAVRSVAVAVCGEKASVRCEKKCMTWSTI